MAACRTTVLLFVVISLCLVHRLVCADWEKTIYTSSSTGRDQKICGSRAKPCRSFDFALNRTIESGTNSTRVFLARGTYNLSSSFIFTRVHDFAIYGNGTKEDVIINCPKANASLGFVLTENITLQGFTLVNCGDWYKTCVGKEEWSVSNPKSIRAIFINYCLNLKVTEVEIRNTPGRGLTAYSMAGVIEFSNSTFRRNIPDGENSTINYKTAEYTRTGGGVFLFVGLSRNNFINITADEAKKYGRGNNVYSFRNCTFDSNIVPMTDQRENFPHRNDETSHPFSRGAGLMIVGTGATGHNMFIIHSSWITGNKAVWGGGLHVEFRRKSHNNTITIADTVFQDNTAKSAGGGARYGSMIYGNPTLAPNVAYFINSQVIRNKARWGGGISIYGPTHLSMLHGKFQKYFGTISFRSCLLARNEGNVGAAIGAFLMNLNEDDIGPQVPFKVGIDNCTIRDNIITRTEQSLVLGQGTVYSDEVPLELQNGVSVTNNSGSAFALDSATMEIADYVEFKYNTGYQGGALAMYGSAKIELKKKSIVLFQENTCKEQGGAIYVTGQGLPLVSFNASFNASFNKCFFSYEEPNVAYDSWDTNVTFQGNGFDHVSSDSLGKSVFASTLQHCRTVGEPRQNNTALEWNFIKYVDKNGSRVSVQEQVATFPVEIRYNPNDWQVAPSQIFNASVDLIDEKQNEIYGIVHIEVFGVNGSNVRLATSSSLFLVHGQITNLILHGRVGSPFKVLLRTAGGVLIAETIKGLTLNKCFPGFTQKPGCKVCLCSSRSNDGIQNCSLNGKEVYIKRGYWAGTVRGHFYTNLCPENYCQGAMSNSLNEEAAYLYNNTTMCSGNRDQSSLLCGSCDPGYSVAFGSDECKTCNNLYLLTFIPYAILLFGIVMLIMLINLDFFTGYLNAWLYSYQVMLLLLPEDFHLDPFIEFVIGIANFQIKTGGSCMMTGIDDADKLVIMYLLPTYILACVFVLERIVQRFPNWCYSKRIRAPFRAFCTLFVLCYTNITSISLKILYPATIAGDTVLFKDGGVTFFQGKHIGYGIIAIIYLILVVIPFPLSLMCTPFFTKVLRPIFNLNKLKPYYDAFQGCFKDEFRWCSAFYFVCRLFLLVISIYVSPGTTKEAVLQGSCMMILVVFVYLKPYKEESNWLNNLDAIMLTNLSFISILSSALKQVGYPTSVGYSVVIKILMYIPLAYLVYITIRVGCERKEQIRLLLQHQMKRDTTEQYSETEQVSGFDAMENQQL